METTVHSNGLDGAKAKLVVIVFLFFLGVGKLLLSPWGREGRNQNVDLDLMVSSV